MCRFLQWAFNSWICSACGERFSSCPRQAFRTLFGAYIHTVVHIYEYLEITQCLLIFAYPCLECFRYRSFLFWLSSSFLLNTGGVDTSIHRKALLLVTAFGCRYAACGSVEGMVDERCAIDLFFAAIHPLGQLLGIQLFVHKAVFVLFLYLVWAHILSL